jgi:hypothetical protein
MLEEGIGMQRFLRFGGVLAAVLGICATANAGLVTYTNRADFLAALVGLHEFESFEDEPLDVQAGSRTIATSTSQIAFSGSGDATFGVNDMVVGGRGPTDGSQYLQVGFINTSSVLFEFAQPLLAFGIDVVDKNVNDLDGIIGDVTQRSAVNQGGEGNVQFWGVIASADMAFTKVGFAGLGPSVPGDTFALDNAVFVHSVPEPCTLILTACAWLSCALVLLRRRYFAG